MFLTPPEARTSNYSESISARYSIHGRKSCLMRPLFLGNIFDDVKALAWILDQADNDSIEELTSPMIEKMIREAKNFVVLFCKYAGYMLIAITHTCYMLRHYTGSTTATSVVETHRNNNLQNGDILSHNYVEQKPDTFLPPERVKGLAMET